MATPYDVASVLPKSRVQAHFDSHVSLYVDKSLECYRQASIDRIALIEKVLPCDSATPFRMLDIGCGGGYFMDLFLEAFPNATACGVDLSTGMLNANTASTRKRLIQADALQLPGDMGEFDVINIDTVMHHLICRSSYGDTMQQICQFLHSLKSLLVPGGVVMIREIYHEYVGIENFGTRLIFGLSTLHLPHFAEQMVKSIGIQTANAGVCFLTRKQWSQLFNRAGFSVTTMEDRVWPSQPYKRYGFKASGDLHYVLSRHRPHIY
jgi:ubiquinone/menaquinone biosynthesis C-methylase UbiE